MQYQYTFKNNAIGPDRIAIKAHLSTAMMFWEEGKFGLEPVSDFYLEFLKPLRYWIPTMNQPVCIQNQAPLKRDHHPATHQSYFGIDMESSTVMHD